MVPRVAGSSPVSHPRNREPANRMDAISAFARTWIEESEVELLFESIEHLFFQAKALYALVSHLWPGVIIYDGLGASSCSFTE